MTWASMRLSGCLATAAMTSDVTGHGRALRPANVDSILLAGIDVAAHVPLCTAVRRAVSAARCVVLNSDGVDAAARSLGTSLCSYELK